MIERRKERAIRLALGATPATIVGQVSKWALVLVSVGLACGVAGALAVARSMAALVDVVSPYHPGDVYLRIPDGGARQRRRLRMATATGGACEPG